MTAREKAIEAGLKAAEDDPRWKFDIYPTGWAEVEDILTIAAPHIESALLDRVEEEIGKLVHEPNRDENGDQSYGYGLGLNAALAVLSQIRQEGQS